MSQVAICDTGDHHDCAIKTLGEQATGNGLPLVFAMPDFRMTNATVATVASAKQRRRVINRWSSDVSTTINVPRLARARKCTNSSYMESVAAHLLTLAARLGRRR